MKVDLTDAATSPLGLAKFRPGRSAAQLQMVLPTLADGTSLRLQSRRGPGERAGSVHVHTGGAEVFAAGRPGLPPGGSRSIYDEALARGGLPSAADYELDITLEGGTVRTYNALPDGLRVSWEEAGVVGYVNLAVLSDGRLSLGFEPENQLAILLSRAGSGVGCGNDWKLRLADNLASGALRGLELAGTDSSVQIQGLTTTPGNPTPGTVFSGHSVQALGNATYHRDAFATSW